MQLVEQKAPYEKFTIPESKTVARGGLTSAAKVDFKKPHPPLLFTAGSEGTIVPAHLDMRIFKRYRKNKESITEYKEFPDRNHFVLGQKTWKEDIELAQTYLIMKISITHIDTACILLEINGYKILTDPTLDKAGKLYYHGSGTFSRKTDNPAIAIDQLHDVDLVLLSHHQHKDNFDDNGKKFSSSVSKIVSTKNAAKVISNTTGLDYWETYKINTSLVPGLKITATLAQHHPWWVPEFLAGKVIGFVIEFEGQENGVIYISGDTVYFKGIDEVARHFKIDIGIFHVGSVQFRYLTGFGHYTMIKASHLVFMSQPKAVADVIEAAAKGSAK